MGNWGLVSFYVRQIDILRNIDFNKFNAFE